MPRPSRVDRLADSKRSSLRDLLGRFGLELVVIAADAPIEGSFWGDEEAGLIEHRVLVRDDTPIHSILHEACHYICMTPDRRQQLDTDAGGDYDEENAVCYLQILLADQLAGFSREKMMTDMDAWGYSFRLGSARAWFERDADDAQAWLREKGLVGRDDHILWQLRTA